MDFGLHQLPGKLPGPGKGKREDEEYPLDGKIIYPIENTDPPEFDLYMYGATDKDMPYLCINRYGSRGHPGDYFINDIRAWGYRD